MMKDIFETRKYLDFKHEDTKYKKNLHELKADIIGKEGDIKKKLKTYALSLNIFLMSLIS